MRSAEERTKRSARGIPLGDRKRALDVLTLAVLVTAFAAAAPPWFLRVMPIQLGPAARLAFLYVVLYLTVSRYADRTRIAWVLPVSLLGLQGAGLAVLGVVWHLVGGLQNPAFILIFVPLVIADGLLIGLGAALLVAVVSVGIVGLTALGESTELSWYLVQFGLPAGWAAALARHAGTAMIGTPSPSPFTPPGHQFMLLTGFAVLQVSAALMSASLAGAIDRLWQRRLTAETPDGASRLVRATVVAAPNPTVVLADDGCVVLTSDSFVDRMLLHGEAIAGRALDELIAFDDPAAVQRTLAGEGGGLLRCRYRVGREARAGELCWYPVQDAGERFTVVVLREVTELDHLERAIGGLDDPFLVVGGDGRVQFANAAAAELFGPLHLGADAAAALARPELPAGWWNEGASPTGRLVTPRAVYRVAIDVVGHRDGRQRIHLVRLCRETRTAPESMPAGSAASRENGGARELTCSWPAAPTG